MCLALCYLSGKEQFCAVQILLLLLLLYSLSSVSVVRARACMCGCRLHLSLSEYMRACTMTVRPTITDNATNQPTVNWETERETQRQTDRGRGGVWGGTLQTHSSEPQTQTQSQFWTLQHFIWRVTKRGNYHNGTQCIRRLHSSTLDLHLTEWWNMYLRRSPIKLWL